jgi:hypothetical protein
LLQLRQLVHWPTQAASAHTSILVALVVRTPQQALAVLVAPQVRLALVALVALDSA